MQCQCIVVQVKVCDEIRQIYCKDVSMSSQEYGSEWVV